MGFENNWGLKHISLYLVCLVYIEDMSCFLSVWGHVLVTEFMNSVPVFLTWISPIFVFQSCQQLVLWHLKDIEVALKNTRPSAHLHAHRYEKFQWWIMEVRFFIKDQPGVLCFIRSLCLYDFGGLKYSYGQGYNMCTSCIMDSCSQGAWWRMTWNGL